MSDILKFLGICFGIIAFFVLFSLFMIFGTYNSLVNLDVNTETKWAKVQTAYERRADLIPNLVNTVKGYSNHEGDIQKEVARLRSGIRNANNPNEMEQINNEMNSLISNLIVSVEAYPDLKASENFLSLQDELSGTENRIKWERDNYNEAVKEYKIKVRRFPSNFVAGFFGFDSNKWDMFEAKDGSENVPEVDLN